LITPPKDYKYLWNLTV